jgi:BspA type Leucine rich repeat region (6 copies)/Hint domain
MATFYVDGITYTIIFSTNVSVTSSISGITRTNLVLDFVTDPATSIVYTITEIGNNVFNTRPGLLGNLTIGASVTSIGNSTFKSCIGLNGTLTFSGPSSLTSIGYEAFYNCSLTGSLAIPGSVTSIGDSAFNSCTGLNGTLTFGAPSLLTSIPYRAFYNCSLLTGSLVIPASITSIETGAFNGCLFLNLTFAQNSALASIGASSFGSCIALTGAITIPAGVTHIGISAFNSCLLLTGPVTIGVGVTYIGNYAFYSCLLLSNYIFLGNAPTTFGTNMFDTGPTPAATITYTLGTSGWPSSAPYLWPPLPYTGTQLVATGVEPSVCVLKDTPICVGVKMYKKIQDLREGDSIIGAVSNTPKKIKQVVITSHKYSDIDPNNVPYKIPADFYAKNIPVQDIYISGTHAIAFSNSKKETVLISVIYAEDFVPATVDELAAFGYPDITYYNIELDEPDGMYAGGVPIETLSLRKSLNL